VQREAEAIVNLFVPAPLTKCYPVVSPTVTSGTWVGSQQIEEEHDMPAKKAMMTKKRAARGARKTGSRTRKQVRSTAKRATRTTKGSATQATKKATRTSRKSARKMAPAGKRRTTSKSSDALALLKSDHARVKDLFRRYKGLGDGALKSKTKTMERIVTELSVHASVEEQVFYPDVKRRVPGSKRLVDHGLDEHQELKKILARLQHMSPDSPEFDAAMRKVIADATDHVKEEETELFPKVRKAMSKQELTDMAALMRTTKRAAPTRPHPLAPSTPPGNVIVGAAAAVVDTVRDAVRSPAKRAR
jgi:hemerythrin superfamily protein